MGDKMKISFCLILSSVLLAVGLTQFNKTHSELVPSDAPQAESDDRENPQDFFEYELENYSGFEKEIIAIGLARLLEKNPDCVFGILSEFMTCRLEAKKKEKLIENWVGCGKIFNAWKIEILLYNLDGEIIQRRFETAPCDSDYLLIRYSEENQPLKVQLTETMSRAVRNILFGN